MMLQFVPVQVWQEGPRFLAKDGGWGIVSEGFTKEEALERLRKGLVLRGREAAPILTPMGPLLQGP